jgi:putative phosphoesterase
MAPARGLKTIGFLADTHSSKADGSDLPDAVLQAFTGVDLIVHLGDIGRKGILPRLAALAPVLVPVGGDKGYVPPDGAGDPVRTVTDGTTVVGLCFNLKNPDKKIAVGDTTLEFTGDPMDKLMQRRFKEPVQVVAYGGTHVAHSATHEGILFLNPGSPNLPSDGPGGSVAVLALGTSPKVDLIRLG